MTTGALPLAYGTTFGKAVPHWAMRSVTWEQFCKLLSKPADAKTKALSYILGTIEPGPGIKCKCDVYLHRTKKTVVSRSAITLDADYCENAGSALIHNLKMLDVTAAAHTTWSSSEDDERYRIIIPTDRDVLPLEYGPIARLVMRSLGEGFFDHTCDQASRLMYLPAAPDGGERYWLETFDLCGPLDVDLWLDLAGGPDTVVEREPVEIHTGSLTSRQNRQLGGLCTKLANCGEGNRDSLLLWSLKAALDDGMDPEIAGAKLAEAAIYAGLEPDVVWEKVGRILG